MTAPSPALAVPTRSPLDRILRLGTLIAPPLIAALYLVLWMLAEAGRFGFGPKALVFALLAVAIGVCGRSPRAALALIVAVPLLQFAGLLWPPESTTWPMYEAFAIVGFFVGAQRERVGWPIAVGAGVVSTVLAVLNMLVPHSFWFVPGVQADFGYGFQLSPRFGWVSWIGQGWSWEDGNGTADNAAGAGMFLMGPAVGPLVGQALLLILFGCLLYLIAWAAGVALSLRGVDRVAVWARAQLGQTKGELRRAEERSAIAREVHDTLAHSLAVVVAQADGGAAAAERDSEAALRSLRVIADVSRSALIECRGLIERIQYDLTDRDDLGPTPEDLPALIDRMRNAGMQVEYRELGEPRPLSATLARTVYRIAQESLTNALKHGDAERSARISADWRGDGLALLVESRGTGAEEAGSGEGNGLGIAGMRERARLSGGWLTASPTEDGAFLVTAFLPTPEMTDAVGVTSHG